MQNVRLTYSTLSLPSGHIRMKHPTYTVCTFCEQLFPSLRQLNVHLFKQHEVTASKTKSYFCWCCSKSCLCLKDLDQHLVEEHQFKSKEAKCQLCDDKSFCNKVTLKVHVVESHDLDFSKTSNTPFVSQLFDIVMEPNLNTINAGFQCPECKRNFSSKRSLSDHKRQVHDKSNHVKCPDCDYSSFQPYMLKRHIARHHDKGTKFKCDECSYFTFHKGTLKVHKTRTHNKINPYPCTKCEKSFDKRITFAQHLLQNHNIVYQWNS